MKKMYRTIVPLWLIFISAVSLPAQDEGFIYGKITTDDNRVYEGPIRWGKEEVYWIDVFNASKEENTNMKYLSRREKETLDENRSWRNGDFIASSLLRSFGIGDHDNRTYERDYTHQFSCQFGEIKSLRPLSSRTVAVELQSGLKFDVDGQGYNDIGEDLKILDKEIGEIAIDWRDIEKIEFTSTPAKLAQKFGEPLYGSVTAYGGTFTGYVQWDHDERVSSDKLDGDSEDGKVSISFDKIKSIEGHMSRSNVTLKSGREVEVRGSNDVNSGNRGIIVTSENGVIRDIPWDEFKTLTLMDAPVRSMKRYDEFKSQKEITGTVTTSDGRTLTGKIILDLDEEYDFELYQGKEGEIEYSIPLRNVKRIAVKNRDRVTVELVKGEKFSLGDSQDVGELNQGVLVFSGKNEPVYVAWLDIKEIQLN